MKARLKSLHFLVDNINVMHSDIKTCFIMFCPNSLS